MNKKTPLVSIIIPTYNEASNIKEMLKRTKKLADTYPMEIIVVDGGSTDDTVNIAKKMEVNKIIKFNQRRGKGIDFWEGVKAATGTYVIQIDADMQFDPQQIPLFIKAFNKGAEVVIAKRESYKQSPLLRTIGNKLMSFFTSTILMYRIYDLLAGFKGAKREVMLSLQLKESGFMYESELVIKTVRMGYKLAQIPVRYYRRKRENSKVNLIKDGLGYVRSILYFGLIAPPPPKLS